MKDWDIPRKSCFKKHLQATKVCENSCSAESFTILPLPSFRETQRDCVHRKSCVNIVRLHRGNEEWLLKANFRFLANSIGAWIVHAFWQTMYIQFVWWKSAQFGKSVAVQQVSVKKSPCQSKLKLCCQNACDLHSNTVRLRNRSMYTGLNGTRIYFACAIKYRYLQ